MRRAFTTSVPLQVVIIVNVRAEHGGTFNRPFFSNGKRWPPSPVLQGVRTVETEALT